MSSTTFFRKFQAPVFYVDHYYTRSTALSAIMEARRPIPPAPIITRSSEIFNSEYSIMPLYDPARGSANAAASKDIFFLVCGKANFPGPEHTQQTHHQ